MLKCVLAEFRYACNGIKLQLVNGVVICSI